MMRLQAALHFSSEAHLPGQLFGLGSHGAFACGALCGELVDEEDDRCEADGRYDVADGMSPGGVIRRSEPIAQSDADKHEKQACPQSMDELVTMCVDAHGVAACRSWDWDARFCVLRN